MELWTMIQELKGKKIGVFSFNLKNVETFITNYYFILNN